MTNLKITPRGGEHELPRTDERADFFRVTDIQDNWLGDFPSRKMAELFLDALKNG